MNSSNLKVLIIASSSQIGRALVNELTALQMDWVALGIMDINLHDMQTINNEFEKLKPTVVLNFAAYSSVAKAEIEIEKCTAINCHVAANLAQVCHKRNITLFHLSTNYIFDGGKSSPYKEDDEAMPLNIYGRSKWQGEQLIRQHCSHHVILRLGWVFSVWRDNENQLRFTRDRLVRPLQQQLCPTPANDISRVIVAMIKQISCDIHVWGTYHYCSSDSTTWQGFGDVIKNEAAKYGATSVGPVVKEDKEINTEIMMKHPKNAVLSCRKLFNTFAIRQRPWRASLSRTVKSLFTVSN